MKLLPILVIALLVFTSINVYAVDMKSDNSTEIVLLEDNISFSEAIIKTKGEYISVNLDETDIVLRSTGKPIIPSYTKTYTFPRGTEIKDVEFTVSDVKIQLIENKIEPTPKPVKIGYIKNSIEQEENEGINIEDKDVYSSSDLYPDRWYDYKVYSGLIDSVPSVILKVNIYPIRYSPAENTIHTLDSIDIQVSYEEPIYQKPLDGKYDMVIVTPKKFKLYLGSLVSHKNRRGVPTTIKTTEDIYNEYTGRDTPEQIKLFLKDAYENWGIKYVLLVGGLKSHVNADDRENDSYGSKDWHVPVRYTNIDGGYISDLYYADLFKGEGQFEDWDSNGNNIFAELWEELDLYPDIYYGRLPCRNIYEVMTTVSKIKQYEKYSYWNSDWFKRMIAVGGVTFNFLSGPGHEGEEPDGEWLCNLSLDYMKYHVNDPVKIYASNKKAPRPIPRDIIREYSKGAGFALFQGHGNAFFWDTRWLNSTGGLSWVGGLQTYHYPFIRNRWKMPIVVVGGCHNAIFNVTIIKTLLDDPRFWLSEYHAYGAIVGACFSEKMVMKRKGGAIACTGCTDYGIGWPSDPLNLSAMLESYFFYKVGIDNVTTLGEAHGGSIQKYMTDVNVQGDTSHTYAITEYQLFGDPSLTIGGKPRTQSVDT